MVYEVKTPTEYFGDAEVEVNVEKLVKGWLASAEQLAGEASDARSRRFGLMRQAGKDVYSTVPPWDGLALTGLVERVLTAARETIAEDEKLRERLKPVVQAIEGLMAPGIPARSGDADGDEPTAWDVLTERLDEQFKKLVELLREQGSVLAMMHSCQQVLGLMQSRIGSHSNMLLLLRDGDLAALALAEGGAVHDLLTRPEHLAAGIRGSGGALMEYIVRRAKARNHTVSLIPLDSAAVRVYTTWGFTGTMQTMVLQPAAADLLLARYTNFAGHAFQ